jgi:signal transduction histidine kinase
VVFHDVPTPVLRTRYEEQIRHGARQEERARLARELHDAVKQQLFAIHTAAATVDARFDSDPAGARDALAQVRASAREALTEMEVMLDQLKATALTTAGLVEALKRACEAMGFRTGAEVSFTAGDLPPDSVFPPGAHLAMLRFAQEALANVARHARAAHVRIRFGIDQEWTPPGSDRRRFVLSISDDGQGFDVSASPRGMGLRSMAGRAAEAGGAMELISTAGQGTTVSLMIISDAATRRRYLTYAALCAALVIVLLLSNAWNQTLGEPWDIAWLVLAVIAAVRFAVAARRVRSWR